MKPSLWWALSLSATAGLVACHVDQLLHSSGQGSAPDSTPARLFFTAQPSKATAGSPIVPPIQVAVLDSTGRRITTYHGNVTLGLAANPGGGSLVGTVTVPASSGVATFQDLSINTPGSGYVLAASTPGAAVANSTPFDVATAPAPPPTHLAFLSQPQSTSAGDPIAPAVQVAAEDSTGAVVPTYAGTITVAIGANPSGGSLGGSTTVAADSGLATFSGLSIDTAGTGYTLIATASGLAGATSQAFDITAPPPPPPPPPSGGSLTVTTTTSGSNLDPDGYTVTVDGSAAQAISDNGAVTFDSLSAASHTVVLSGVASNCAAGGGTSQTATVPAGGSASVAFAIGCQAPPPSTGSLTVTTTTSGSNPDPDGYTVSVDGGGSQSISDNGSVTFGALVSGMHTVALSGLASNCQAGTTSQTIAVPAGGSTSASFAVTCQGSPPPANQPPVVSAGGNQSVLEGVLYQLNASFTDPDDNGPWIYSVNWGDGTSDSGTLSAQGAIGPTHTYLAPGSYQITVTVTDAGGASGSDTKTLTVTL